LVSTHLRVVALWKHQAQLEEKLDETLEAQATGATRVDAKIDQLREAQARMSQNLDVWLGPQFAKPTTPSPDDKKGQPCGQDPVGVKPSAEAPPAPKLFVAELEEHPMELVEDSNGFAAARPGFILED